MNPIRRLFSARLHRRPAPGASARLRCLRLEDRTVPASFQGLGMLPGGNATFVHDLSADGSTVVGESNYSSGPTHAFRWTAGTGLIDLGILPGQTQAIATGASGDGSLVTGYSSGGGATLPFSWTAPTGMVQMGGPPSPSSAYAVSQDGTTVVGTALLNGSNHAYRYTIATGVVDDLGVLPGSGSSRALSVSEHGSVVVGYCYNGGYQRAFRWTQATGMVGLGALPLSGLFDVEATDVSADGSVVVGWCQALSGDRAFRWTQATGMVDYGPAPGATDSRVLGVSADASVAVGFALVSLGDSRAIRWTALSHPRDLQDDLINLYGLGTQLSGWTLNSAVSCSANGRVIAGYGTDPAGHGEAWVAHVDPLPPHVTETQINGGAVQRSRVTDLAVTFDSQVNFTISPTAAFTLTRNSDNAPVSFTATALVVDAMTVVVLHTFTGSATDFASLADGRYTLTALASQISAGGVNMTSNYTFDDTQGLFRLYGDVNGDQTVNGLDFGFFKNAFGTQLGDAAYLSYLDLNGDGVINGFDFGQFRLRFGTVLP